MQKIFKTGVIIWHTVAVHNMSKWLQKRLFSSATPQLDEAMDQSETPL